MLQTRQTAASATVNTAFESQRARPDLLQIGVENKLFLISKITKLSLLKTGNNPV